MKKRLQLLSASEIRDLLLQENKKFKAGLDFGSTSSDLQEIRDQIKMLEIILVDKEREEFPHSVGEKFQQSLADGKDSPFQ